MPRQVRSIHHHQVAWCALLSLAAAFCGLLGCNRTEFVTCVTNGHDTRRVEAEYAGLRGESYAVMVDVATDVERDFPGIAAELTKQVHKQLRTPDAQAAIGSPSAIPEETVFEYLVAHPEKTTWSRAQLARGLGVDGLIIIALSEYHLVDPANAQVWTGKAEGAMEVWKADTGGTAEPAFQKLVTVTFPDRPEYGPDELFKETVSTELTRRFVDRTTWPLFAHSERYFPRY